MAEKKPVPLSGSERGRNSTSTAIRVREFGDEDRKKEITVTITLSGPELPGPEKFVGHRGMTHDKLEEKFGAKPKDAKKVSDFLKKHHLEVIEVSLITRSMRVRGTIKDMEDVFQPDLWAIWRSLTQGSYLGRQGEIHPPKELEGIVTGVFGLDQRQMAHRRSGAAGSAGDGSAPAPMKPSDIEQRYNFPPGDGKGQSIVIAQFGGAYLPNDMSVYSIMFGRPTPKVKLVSVNAPAYTLEDILALPDPTPRKDKLEESFEVSTDVEIIGGLCPKANISIYFSTFDERGWIDLLDKVIVARPVPVALSISWGFPEDDKDDQWSDAGIIAINDRLNLARLLGITICVAAGDDGCRGEVHKGGRAHVDFPSASPNVMAVGGTMLDESGEEVTWSDDPDHPEGVTGGGVSTIFLRPAWQNVNIDSINPGSNKGGVEKFRVVPDVAALAGKPYYRLFFLNLPWSGGKTSASAPVWAALIARINAKLPQAKRRRFLTPLLYKELKNGQLVGEAAFRDITAGNNKYLGTRLKGYNACKGFDAVTGWGVPNGVDLLNCLKQI